jgi:hypothetical protein
MQFMRATMARASLLAAPAVALLLTCAASDPPRGPRISDYPPGTGGGIGLDLTKANTTYAFDDASLCLTNRGSVTVERVEVAAPTGGLRVQTFAVRPAGTGETFNYLSDARQRLTDVGYRVDGPIRVDRACPADPTAIPAPGEEVDLLGVEVVKPSDATATGNGFVVTYRSGRERRRAYVPLGIVLCAGKTEESRPECEP